MGGLLEELEDVLDLATAGSVELIDGAIRITGRSGLSHELTELTFAETGNTVLPGATAFTARHRLG